MPCKCKVLRLIPSIPLQKKIFGNHVPPKATIRNVDISEGVQQDPGECAVQALERKRTCGQRQEGVWQVQACLALHLRKKSGCSGEDDGGMSTDTDELCGGFMERLELCTCGYSRWIWEQWCPMQGGGRPWTDTGSGSSLGPGSSQSKTNFWDSHLHNSNLKENENNYQKL